jgi:N-methylhydantoinase A
MSHERDAARSSFEPLAERLATTPEVIAQAAYDLVNRDIANAIASKAFDRAIDVRASSLFAYGGAGPLHAVDAARALGMTSVVVPYFPGGFSAFGMLTARPNVEHVYAPMRNLDAEPAENLEREFQELVNAARDDLTAQGVRSSDISFERHIYVMYVGQSFDNRLSIPDEPMTDEGIAAIRSLTDDFYDQVYGYRAPELGVVVTTIAVTARGAASNLNLPKIDVGKKDIEGSAVLLTRPGIFAGQEYGEVPFISRAELRSGNEFTGPAVIDDELGTILVPPDCTVSVDQNATIRIDW